MNECLVDNLCLNEGTCGNTPGSYTCSCIDGWEGDNCQTGREKFILLLLKISIVLILLKTKLYFTHIYSYAHRTNS